MASKDNQRLILYLDYIKAEAAENLSTTAREFYDAGSTDQITVNENTAAYSKYRLRPRVLIDVSKADTTTTLFGQKSPSRSACRRAMAHPDGELATSRACAKRGIHMGVSSFANSSVQDIRAAGLAVGPSHHVMQLYTMQDRSH